MSRIYFHSPSGEAEVLGSERAYMGWVVQRVAMSAVNLDWADGASRIFSLLDPNHYMAKEKIYSHETSVVDRRWSEMMERSLGSSMFGDTLQWKGSPIGSFSLLLNTAVVLGSDEVKLSARLHGQCEIHAYVEGPNRSWLADLIQSAVDKAIFREVQGEWPSGWNEVITLLRSRDDEPVVTSYSVCDGFPDYMVGDWMPAWPEGVPRSYRELSEEQKKERDERSEAWYELPHTEQWRISLEGLRTGTGGLEMKPDNWNTFKFGHGLSFLDIMAVNYAERLEAADLTPQEER